MEVIVDRIEGDFLIVEINEGNFVNMPKVLAPNAKEGDVIVINIDESKRKMLLNNVNELVNNLFED